jgi:hypothetical protein
MHGRGENRNACRILVGRPTADHLDDLSGDVSSIKADSTEIWQGDLNSFFSEQRLRLGSCERKRKLSFPLNTIHFLN